MRIPDGDAEPGAAPPRDWSSLDAYGDADERWRRYSQRTRRPPSLRRLPKTPRWTVSTLFHFILILALGALAMLIIIAGMPRTRHWVGPKELQSEAGTAEPGWPGG
jgi:hypothetical protein